MEIPRQKPVRDLETLCTSETLPRLFAGDVIDLGGKDYESLKSFSGLLVEDLLNEYQTPSLNKLKARLREEFIEFDDLPLLEQDELYIAEVPQLLFPDSDIGNLKSRVARNFDTGVLFQSAQLLGKEHVEIGGGKHNEYYGWVANITASLSLPDVMPGTQIQFPFVVVHNDYMFRVGPYSKKGPGIAQLETPEFQRALAVPRTKPGAFVGQGVQRQKSKARRSKPIPKKRSGLSGEPDGFF